MHRLAVFASGNGSNAENLIRHFSESPVARVSLVVTNRPDAGVIGRARRLGVEVMVMTRAEINDETLMLHALRSRDIDTVVLAGFLLMVPGFLIKAMPDRIVNIHPSLLPKFGGKGMYGHHVHEAVVAAGERRSGITVHYVSDVCDGGRIIEQVETDIDPTDTPADVERKIHALEAAHFPRIIESLLS